jgi:hypothetical protein
LDEIEKLNEQYIKESKKENLNIIISKIAYLRSQIDLYRANNKFFYKTKEVKYIAILDPFVKYTSTPIITTEKASTNLKPRVFIHAIKPNHLFPKNKDKSTIPEVKLSVDERVTATGRLPLNKFENRGNK